MQVEMVVKRRLRAVVLPDNNCTAVNTRRWSHSESEARCGGVSRHLIGTICGVTRDVRQKEILAFGILDRLPRQKSLVAATVIFTTTNHADSAEFPEDYCTFSRHYCTTSRRGNNGGPSFINGAFMHFFIAGKGNGIGFLMAESV
jgi:hypothetical protein